MPGPQELRPRERLVSKKQMEKKISLFSMLLALFAHHLGYSLAHTFKIMCYKGGSML